MSPGAELFGARYRNRGALHSVPGHREDRQLVQVKGCIAFERVHALWRRAASVGDHHVHDLA